MLIATITVIALAFTCVTRCRSPVSFLQLKFWMAYMNHENELFESLATEHAKNLAQRNVRSFFESTEPPAMKTPDNKAWEKISALYKFSTKDHYYSKLHKAELCSATDGFNTVVKFFMNQKSTIGYSFMALLTVGGERIFSIVSFQCPFNKSQNFSYGLVFIVGPALALFIIGYFVSARTWKLFTGCCLNPRKLCPRRNACYCMYVFAQITVGACIPPVMWLTVVLLNGTFYECAVSGLEDNHVVDLFCKHTNDECQVELPKVPCGKSNLSSADNQELLLMLRAQSQVWSAHAFCVPAFDYIIYPLLP
ncbi:CAHM5 protein, partial [Polyodon spathula]|nr:CAHM5 protein [Polyodon spathula]